MNHNTSKYSQSNSCLGKIYRISQVILYTRNNFQSVLMEMKGGKMVWKQIIGKDVPSEGCEEGSEPGLSLWLFNGHLPGHDRFRISITNCT